MRTARARIDIDRALEAFVDVYGAPAPRRRRPRWVLLKGPGIMVLLAGCDCWIDLAYLLRWRGADDVGCGRGARVFTTRAAADRYRKRWGMGAWRSMEVVRVLP